MRKALGLYKVALFQILTTIMIGLLVLLVWQFDLIAVKNIFPEQQISNPLTSLCFILCGACLLLLLNDKKMFRLLARLLAAVVLFIGAIVFCSAIFRFHTGIDKWLYEDKLLLYGNRGKPNYMAPNTALCFFFLSVSIVRKKSFYPAFHFNEQCT